MVAVQEGLGLWLGQVGLVDRGGWGWWRVGEDHCRHRQVAGWRREGNAPTGVYNRYGQRRGVLELGDVLEEALQERLGPCGGREGVFKITREFLNFEIPYLS